jgi:hypothetical protein
MPLSRIFHKNPIKKLSSDELKDMELNLNVKTDRLTEEVARIEQEIQKLFQKGKETESHLEEVSLASHIKTLCRKKELKAAAHAQLEKELRAVSNMLIIKEHETDLKNAGVWEPLERIPPADLEAYLIERKLEAEDRQAAVRVVTDLTSSILNPTTGYEEGLEDILSVMREVRQGKLEPEMASDIVSKERKLETK